MILHFNKEKMFEIANVYETICCNKAIDGINTENSDALVVLKNILDGENEISFAAEKVDKVIKVINTGKADNNYIAALIGIMAGIIFAENNRLDLHDDFEFFFYGNEDEEDAYEE